MAPRIYQIQSLNLRLTVRGWNGLCVYLCISVCDFVRVGWLI